jgi:hypothetical protein
MSLHQQRGRRQAHTGQGRQQMLHGGQAAVIQLESRAQLGLTHLPWVERLQGLLGGIQPSDPKARLIAGL